MDHKFAKHVQQIVMNARRILYAVLVRLIILRHQKINVVWHQITVKSVILKPQKLARLARLESI